MKGDVREKEEKERKGREREGKKERKRGEKKKELKIVFWNVTGVKGRMRIFGRKSENEM